MQDSTNIIYLSNIVDHITERGSQFENASVMGNLKAYESSTKPPIVVDSLASLKYYLRVRNSIPDYSFDDVQYKGYVSARERTEKPDGLVFADQETGKSTISSSEHGDRSPPA